MIYLIRVTVELFDLLIQGRLVHIQFIRHSHPLHPTLTYKNDLYMIPFFTSFSLVSHISSISSQISENLWFQSSFGWGRSSKINEIEIWTHLKNCSYFNFQTTLSVNWWNFSISSLKATKASLICFLWLSHLLN